MRTAETDNRGPEKLVKPGSQSRLEEELEQERAQRKRLEASLADLEKGFNLLFNHNPNPMWVIDLNTIKFIDVNEAAILHYGYTRREFLNMSLTEMRPPEDVPRFLENFQRHKSSGNELSGLRSRHLRKDGAVINVELNSQLLNYRGRIARLVMAVDISEQTKAEEAYREADRKYHEIFKNAVEGIFQSSTDGRYLAANPAFARMFGYDSPEEICSIDNIASQIYVQSELR
jgi:PAS domain S-box-containing protein